MAVETAADRAGYFDTEDFGVEATVAPVGGGAAYAVRGILDAESNPLELEGGGFVMARELRFHCATESLANPQKGDAITINGTTYTVVWVQDDGANLAELGLHS
ncbi:MAG: hypothetical protein KC560_12215 [Myxococcales bacterium]|nr:hypothetical protein [Myxococcales bacterium]